MKNNDLIHLNLEKFKKELLQKIGDQFDQLRIEFEPKQPEEYLTRKQTAIIFKVNLSTLYNWSRRGLIKKYAIGNRIYFRRSEIEKSLIQIN